MTEDGMKKVRRSSLWDHLALIIKWRKLFIIVMLIMAVSSVTYSLLVKKWYYADARMLPPPPDVFSMAGMMPDLGLGILGMSRGFTVETRLLVSILSSRRIMDRVINEFDWMNTYHLKYRFDAYERYKKNVRWEVSEEGYIYVRVNDIDPERSADMVNFIVDELATEYNSISIAQARNQRMFIEKRLNEAKADLTALEEKMKEFQQKTGAISIEDQLRSTVTAVAELKTQQILADVQLEVFEKTMPENSSMVIQARERSRALEQQVNRMLHSSEEEDYPSMLIKMDLAPEIGMEFLRLTRDIQIQSTVIEFLMPQYEQARISESREKGNLYVLDRGEVPEHKYKPKRAFIVLGWMFLSFVILYYYVVFLEWMRRMRTDDPVRYRHISGVLNGLKPRNFFSLKDRTKGGEPRE